MKGQMVDDQRLSRLQVSMDRVGVFTNALLYPYYFSHFERISTVTSGWCCTLRNVSESIRHMGIQKLPDPEVKPRRKTASSRLGSGSASDQGPDTDHDLVESQEW
jgi:hypothetical protein